MNFKSHHVLSKREKIVLVGEKCKIGRKIILLSGIVVVVTGWDVCVKAHRSLYQKSICLFAILKK